MFNLYRFRPVLYAWNVTTFVPRWPVRFLWSAVARRRFGCAFLSAPPTAIVRNTKRTQNESGVHVHRNGVMGSPRVTGPTSCSSAAAKSGSASLARFRPPPDWRSRLATGVAGPPSRLFNSARPFLISLHLVPLHLVPPLGRPALSRPSIARLFD